MPALSLLLIPLHAPPPGGPLGFLIGAAAMFFLCWIWIGGYLADFVVWVIAKLTPDSSNERALAYILGGAFVILGVIVAFQVAATSVGTFGGGMIAGAGLYVAVRLPGRIRRNRAAKAASQPPTPPPAPAWPQVQTPSPGALRPPPPPPPPPAHASSQAPGSNGVSDDPSWPRPLQSTSGSDPFASDGNTAAS